VNALKRFGRWIRDSFWAAESLQTAQTRVYRHGGKNRIIEDLVVKGSRSEYPFADEMRARLIEDRLRQEASEPPAESRHLSAPRERLNPCTTAGAGRLAPPLPVKSMLDERLDDIEVDERGVVGGLQPVDRSGPPGCCASWARPRPTAAGK
jgi:hypothetical protein